MMDDAEAASAAAQGDPDAGDRCAKRLLDLRIAIDEVEDALEWRLLVAGAEHDLDMWHKIVHEPSSKATLEEKTGFAVLEREIREAVDGGDPDILRRKVLELTRFGHLLMSRLPEYWIAHFQHLEQKKHVMTSAAHAEQCFLQGRRAINNNDVEGLRVAVQQLVGLLPADDVDREKSSVMRAMQGFR